MRFNFKINFMDLVLMVAITLVVALWAHKATAADDGKLPDTLDAIKGWDICKVVLKNPTQKQIDALAKLKREAGCRS